MKTYEKEIRRRMYIKIMFCIIGGIAILVAIILKLLIKDGTQGISDFSVSVLVGMFGGIEAFSIPPILKYRKALKDKVELETLHINETDERNQMIELKTCRTCFYITLTLLGYAGLIAAMFNKIIFFTLGIVLIILCVIYLIVKIVYIRHSYK